jgi:hypothetical protein
VLSHNLDSWVGLFSLDSNIHGTIRDDGDDGDDDEQGRKKNRVFI